MSHSEIDWLGWLATAVFVASYFFKAPSWLRGAQMLGAVLWILYGALIRSTPVVVANVLVFSAAAGTGLRVMAAERVQRAQRRQAQAPGSATP